MGLGNWGFGVFGNNGASWDSSPIAAQGGGSSSGHNNGIIGENNFVLGRNNGAGVVTTTSSFNALSHNLIYGHVTWQSSSNELDSSVAFGYGLDKAEEVMGRSSEGYFGNYSTANRQPNRELLRRYWNVSLGERESSETQGL